MGSGRHTVPAWRLDHDDGQTQGTDRLRRDDSFRRKRDALEQLLESEQRFGQHELQVTEPADRGHDDRLRLVFTCCHPALAVEAQVALTLRTVAGTELVRGDLCGEAMQLGRLVVELMPDEPEAAALLALMLLHDSRRAARIDEEGRRGYLERRLEELRGPPPDSA